MAVVEFGFAMVLRNFASVMTRMTRIESNAKRMSKAFVENAKATVVTRQAQQKLADVQQRGLTVSKQARDALRLHTTTLAKQRAEQALVTAETVKQAREYIGLAFALGLVAAAFAKFNVDNLKASLGAEKSTIALEVLTENMNLNRDAVEAEIAELRELNLTRAEAERMVARFTKAELDIAQASDVALALTRLSIISDIERAKALELGTNAIVRRRLRQLQALDVGIKYNKAIEDSAKLLEVEGKLLTDSERSQAILNVIIREGNKLRGVENEYIKTGTGLLDSYNTQVKDLQRSLGDTLLPSLIEVLKAGNAFLEWLNKLPKIVKDALSASAALVGVVTAVGTSIVTVLTVLKVAGFATGAFAASITAALPTIGLIVAALAAVAGAALLAYKAIKTLRGAPIEEAVEMVEKIYKFTAPFISETARRAAAELFVHKFREIFGKVEDEAKRAGRRTGEAFIEGLIEGIDSQIRRIDVDLSLIEKAFETEKLKAELILIPLEQQERLLQRLIILAQREAEEFAYLTEGPGSPLRNARKQLELLADISKDLGRALRPYEHALQRVEASAGEILIPLKAQERSLQRQLALLERRIVLERRSLENAVRAAELSLRDIEDQVYTLDKALWPLRDAFTQISADADLVLIPLRRQRREIERQIDRMERLSEIEQKRIERHLRALEKQRDALQDIIDADRKRLDIINHEIFMEQQRNRILQRVTSARFLTMQSQAAVMQDQLALRQEEMKALNKQTKDERERLRDMKDALDEQLEPIRKRLQILIDAIDLEEERVTFAKENLQLEEARQAAARIALEQQSRLAEREVELSQRRLDDFDELAKLRTRALEDELVNLGFIISDEEERIQIARDALELARLQQTETRIALEEAVSLWEDRRDVAELHLAKVKELQEVQMKALKDQLIITQDIIFEVERRLKVMEDIKDQVEITLKLEKEQYELEKKRLETLKKIAALPLITKGGTTGDVTTEPTVTAPPVGPPTPPIVIVPTGTPGPTVQLEAHYSTAQSAATIVDDVELMLAYAR